MATDPWPTSRFDLQCWREAAEADWIRRACFNALPDELQMTVHRHELAEKRGATLVEVVDDGTGRYNGGRFHVVRSRKP